MFYRKRKAAARHAALDKLATLRERAERRQIVLIELATLRDWAQGRLDAGDLDFDDCVYRTRDATTTLLEIYGNEVKDTTTTTKEKTI